jgi:nitrate reductase beta subunit
MFQQVQDAKLDWKQETSWDPAWDMYTCVAGWKATGYDAEDTTNLFAAIDSLRIPVEYLAELFTAGDVKPVDRVLKKLAAMRSYMRDINMGRDPDGTIPAAVGMTEEDMYDMYRLLAIAKYDERYVIPPAHAEQAHSLEELATELDGKLKIAKVNIDDNDAVAAEFGVRAIPTMILFKGGQVAETLVGMMPKAALKAKLATHIG